MQVGIPSKDSGKVVQAILRKRKARTESLERALRACVHPCASMCILMCMACAAGAHQVARRRVGRRLQGAVQEVPGREAQPLDARSARQSQCVQCPQCTTGAPALCVWAQVEKAYDDEEALKGFCVVQ